MERASTARVRRENVRRDYILVCDCTAAPRGTQRDWARLTVTVTVAEQRVKGRVPDNSKKVHHVGEREGRVYGLARFSERGKRTHGPRTLHCLTVAKLPSVPSNS